MRTGRSSLREGTSPAGQAEDGVERLSLEGVVLAQDLSDLFHIRSGKEILEIKGDHPIRTDMGLGIRDNGKLGVETMSGGMRGDFVEQAVEQPALDEFEKRLGGFDPAGAPSSCLERKAFIEFLSLTGKLGKPVLVHAKKPCQVIQVRQSFIWTCHAEPSLFGGEVFGPDRGKSMAFFSHPHLVGNEVVQGLSIPVRDQPYASDVGVPFFFFSRIKFKFLLPSALEVDPIDFHGEIQLVGKMDSDFHGTP